MLYTFSITSCDDLGKQLLTIVSPDKIMLPYKCSHTVHIEDTISYTLHHCIVHYLGNHFLNPIFLGLEVAAMAMYHITVKAPLTVPLYLYFASAKYRYNGTVRGALTVTYACMHASLVLGT